MDDRYLGTINWDSLDGEAAKGILLRIWPFVERKKREKGYHNFTRIEASLLNEIEYYHDDRVKCRKKHGGQDENYV